MVWFGEKGVLRVLCYSCWFPSRPVNNYSCHTMHLCLEVIWAGTGHWPSWLIASIGRASRMMSRNASSNVPFASRGNHRPDDIIPWGTFRPVIDGIVSLWTSWTFVTRLRTVVGTFWWLWTTSVNVRRPSQSRISVQTQWRMYWWKRSFLRFGMRLVIHSDQGREFENGLMKSLCTLLGCTTTRMVPYRPESDGMIERFNRTCLMMLSMFVNDRWDNWNELLPYVMYAYRTSVYESTGYSPFRLMMGEECSLPQDVSTSELRTNQGVL